MSRLIVVMTLIGNVIKVALFPAVFLCAITFLDLSPGIGLVIALLCCLNHQSREIIQLQRRQQEKP